MSSIRPPVTDAMPMGEVASRLVELTATAEAQGADELALAPTIERGEVGARPARVVGGLQVLVPAELRGRLEEGKVIYRLLNLFRELSRCIEGRTGPRR